jgi:hypothetical protein
MGVGAAFTIFPGGSTTDGSVGDGDDDEHAATKSKGTKLKATRRNMVESVPSP